MSSTSASENERALKQSYTEGDFDKSKIWTTFPLDSRIGIPPPDHLAQIPLEIEDIMRLPDDLAGNARWTTFHAVAIHFSRYRVPVHPASRSYNELVEMNKKRRAEMDKVEGVERESSVGMSTSGTEGTKSESPEVGESFDQGEDSRSESERGTGGKSAEKKG